jgi:hypothetical protein
VAYAGFPYQVFGERDGALALTIAWSRSAKARSGPGISAIFASTARSPAAASLLARASAFSSRARSFIAARSSSVNPLDVEPVLAALAADICAPFFAGFLSAIARHLHTGTAQQRELAQALRRGSAAHVRDRATPQESAVERRP